MCHIQFQVMDHVDLPGVLDLSDGLPDGLDLPDVLHPPDVQFVQEEEEDALRAREKLPLLHDKMACLKKKRK
jgi:hypothetical protein